ncbi:unnamed protein product [Spirodela intermedia]|uniref:Response regulatory domain-containing protein n=1 Tax=Spirodela intermedia TaxID=51605 RepID=A0A7I8IFL5_SPIIN|nr:unnamed protein product [Spirodela intermedia]CAA6656489.1 unnamed protein product [Spirodela intermedia]
MYILIKNTIFWDVSCDQQTRTTMDAIFSIIFPHGLQAMIVDEDHICLSIITNLLKECKFKVAQFTKPSVALSTFRVEGSGCHLIVIAVPTMEMDAFSLLEEARKEHHVPALMMTRRPSPEVAEKCKSYGDCYYLHLPTGVPELMNFVFDALSWWWSRTTYAAKGSEARNQLSQDVQTAVPPPRDWFSGRRPEQHREDMAPETKKAISDALDKLDAHLSVAKKVIGMRGRVPSIARGLFGLRFVGFHFIRALWRGVGHPGDWCNYINLFLATAPHHMTLPNQVCNCVVACQLACIYLMLLFLLCRKILVSLKVSCDSSLNFYTP